ncbi:MAG: biotin--[acetyl-CoA-carboxylase] ligase [Elusimicrobiota bacterium]
MKTPLRGIPGGVPSSGFPGNILRLRSTPSTQAVARRLAAEGAPAWTLVRADRQTRGRGRLERSWSSGAGGLYVSLVLRPRLAPAALADLSLLFGEACAAALRALTGLETFVKPPNDVLARAGDGSWRKVCGILLEASGDSKMVDWVVAGIGINVRNRIPRALPEAASIQTLTGRAPETDEVLDAVLKELRRRMKS